MANEYNRSGLKKDGMDEALERFLLATSTNEIHKTAFELHHNWKAEYFWPFISALRSPEEPKRYEAAYTLGFRSTRRAIPFLTAALSHANESERVRGQAAEALGQSLKRKVIPVLAACSADPSPEVRFWCVFSLGHFVRRLKTPPQVVRALEARLDDRERPSQRGHYWPIGWEALAMLNGCKTSRFPVSTMFRDFMLETLRDPEAHSDRLSWAAWYWHPPKRTSAEAELWAEALRNSQSRGFDPETYGRATPPSTDPH
jgi:hypothetical protein